MLGLSQKLLVRFAIFAGSLPGLVCSKILFMFNFTYPSLFYMHFSHYLVVGMSQSLKNMKSYPSNYFTVSRVVVNHHNFLTRFFTMTSLVSHTNQREPRGGIKFDNVNYYLIQFNPKTIDKNDKKKMLPVP